MTERLKRLALAAKSPARKRATHARPQRDFMQRMCPPPAWKVGQLLFPERLACGAITTGELLRGPRWRMVAAKSSGQKEFRKTRHRRRATSHRDKLARDGVVKQSWRGIHDPPQTWIRKPWKRSNRFHFISLFSFTRLDSCSRVVFNYIPSLFFFLFVYTLFQELIAKNVRLFVYRIKEIYPMNNVISLGATAFVSMSVFD